MKSVVAALVSLIFVTSAFAFDGRQPPGGAGGNFEARKAEILKRIDERMTRLQEMKACIQAAQIHEDAKACMEKFGKKNGPENRGK
jgi:hypothetical protein